MGSMILTPLLGSWKYHLRRRLHPLTGSTTWVDLEGIPQIDQFKNGHGEFFAQDTLNGKSIFVRFDWSGLTAKSPHFEQSFSDDGGKTWEVNWITDQTWIGDASDKAQ
jgi:hypothetical protein